MKFGISLRPSSSVLSGILLFFIAQALAGRAFALGVAVGVILSAIIALFEALTAHKKDSDND